MPVAAISPLGRSVEVAPDEVDVAFGQYVRRDLDDIEAALMESYPRRSHLLKEAFEAHREYKFSLSIQAFLTQSDGIFYERFGSSFFMKGRKEAVSAFSSEIRGRFLQAVLHPLTIYAPLWEDTRGLEDTFEGLNRHQVLHGMKADYNTELNSLKAISLLDNLAWVLNT